MLALSNHHVVFVEPMPGKLYTDWEYYNYEHDYTQILNQLGASHTITPIDNLVGIYHIEKH
jgi:hypothetical protein